MGREQKIVEVPNLETGMIDEFVASETRRVNPIKTESEFEEMIIEEMRKNKSPDSFDKQVEEFWRSKLE